MAQTVKTAVAELFREERVRQEDRLRVWDVSSRDFHTTLGHARDTHNDQRLAAALAPVTAIAEEARVAAINGLAIGQEVKAQMGGVGAEIAGSMGPLLMNLQASLQDLPAALAGSIRHSQPARPLAQAALTAAGSFPMDLTSSMVQRRSRDDTAHPAVRPNEAHSTLPPP